MTEVKKASEITWASKVMARLNLSEEGKVGLFGDKLKRVIEKRIIDKEEEVAKLERQLKNTMIEMNEQLNEVKDEYSDAFITIDLTRITDTDSRKAYAEPFVNALMKKKNAVINFVQKIEDTKNSYDKQIKEFKDSVAAYEEFLSNI